MKRGPRKPRAHGELDPKKEYVNLSAPGPVKTYTLPPEEIERIFKDVKPMPKPSFYNFEMYT